MSEHPVVIFCGVVWILMDLFGSEVVSFPHSNDVENTLEYL